MIRSIKNKIYKLLPRSLTSTKDIKPEVVKDNSEVIIDYSTMPATDMNTLFNNMLANGFVCGRILDIGAHSTEWSTDAKEIFTYSNIFLIEPLEEMEEKLKEFCIKNPGSEYLMKGVGSKEEKKIFTVIDNMEGANFLFEKRDHLIKKNQQREVEIITIDSLIESNKIKIPDLIKIDVQGFELEVLKGATKVFGKTEAFIIELSFFKFMEGTPLFSEVVTFMAEKGYEVYDFPGFLRRPFDNALGQVDVCFVKRDGILRSSNRWRVPPVRKQPESENK